MNRKKSLLISLLLLQSISIISIQIVESPYLVIPETRYNYKSIRANIEIDFENQTKLVGKGFTVESTKFNQRTEFSAQVDSLGGDNVLWTLICGDESTSKLADWNLVDESKLSALIMNPLEIVEPFYEGNRRTSDGLGLIFYPFLGTRRTINFFKALDNRTHYQVSFSSGLYENLEFSSFVLETKDVITFESFIIGTQLDNESDYLQNINIEHQTIFTYNKSNGVLLGSRIKSTGYNPNNSEEKYSFESLIKLDSYSTPCFELGRVRFDCNGGFFLVFLLVSLSITFATTASFTLLNIIFGKSKKPFS